MGILPCVLHYMCYLPLAPSQTGCWHSLWHGLSRVKHRSVLVGTYASCDHTHRDGCCTRNDSFCLIAYLCLPERRWATPTSYASGGHASASISYWRVPGGSIAAFRLNTQRTLSRTAACRAPRASEAGMVIVPRQRPTQQERGGADEFTHGVPLHRERTNHVMYYKRVNG